MADHTRAALRPSRWTLLGAPALSAALGLAAAVLSEGLDPSAPAWSLLRPVALLAAGAIPVRLAAEAVAYCTDTAHKTGDRAAAWTASTHSFGRASLPGRDALPTGSAHI